MSQTTYNLAPPVGMEGQVADMREGTVIVPRLAQGLVPVGKLAIYGTNSLVGPPATTVSSASTTPGQVRAFQPGVTDNPLLPSEFIGVPIYDATREPYDSTLGYSCYADKDQVPVLRRGPIYVAVEAGSTPTQGADVYVRVTANGSNTVLGRFATGPGTGLALMPTTIARWDSGQMQGFLSTGVPGTVAVLVLG